MLDFSISKSLLPRNQPLIKNHLFLNIISIQQVSNQPTTESGLGAAEQPKIYI